MRWGKVTSEIIRVKLKFKKRYGGIIAQIPPSNLGSLPNPAFWLPYLSKTFPSLEYSDTCGEGHWYKQWCDGGEQGDP